MIFSIEICKKIQTPSRCLIKEKRNRSENQFCQSQHQGKVEMVVHGVAEVLFFCVLFVAGSSSPADDAGAARSPRQSHDKHGEDQNSAETGFLGGGGVENSKYFHYQHLPEHDKYEFGHRRGNEHHVVERYEKAIPHEGQFKTKVRWADKKGGHGEHYWDYNHAGHEGNGGHNEGDKNGGYSDPVPAYSPIEKSPKYHQKRESEQEKRVTLEDVESPQRRPKEGLIFRDDLERERVEEYEIQKETGKGKRESAKGISDESHLFFDLNSGTVVDELTGKKYILQPVN